MDVNKSLDVDAVVYDMFGTLTVGNAQGENLFEQEWKLKDNYGVSQEKLEAVGCGTACKTPFTEIDRTMYYQALRKEFGLPEGSEEKMRQLLEGDISQEAMAPGFKEILRYTHDQGYIMGMISDLPNPDYDLMAKHKVDNLFSFRHMSYDPDWATMRGNTYGAIKPEPKIFERVMENLGTTPEKTLMIGNSLNSDINPAKALGMPTILVDFDNKYAEYDIDRMNYRVTELAQIKGII